MYPLNNIKHARFIFDKMFVLNHKSCKKAWCYRGYNENANNRPLASKSVQKLCWKGKRIPNAIFIYSPALQRTAPFRIDCSWPLSPAQTQTQTTLCQTEATQIGSGKKDTEKLSFFFVSVRSSVRKTCKVSRRLVRQKIKALFGIFLSSLICHVLTQES